MLLPLTGLLSCPSSCSSYVQPPREDTQRFPAKAVYGSQLVLPGLLPSEDPSGDLFLQLERTIAVFKALLARRNISFVARLPVDPPDAVKVAQTVLVSREGEHQPLEPV